MKLTWKEQYVRIITKILFIYSRCQSERCGAPSQHAVQAGAQSNVATTSAVQPNVSNAAGISNI